VAAKLEAKVSVVTGGDQGIGRGVAIRLARDGSDIALCYRKNLEGAQEVVSQIQARQKGDCHPGGCFPSRRRTALHLGSRLVLLPSVARREIMAITARNNCRKHQTLPLHKWGS